MERNKAGAQFILEVVLHQASSPVLLAFKEMDPEFIPFLLTKAVATYAVDPKYAVQDLPPFFTPKTKKEIVALRQQLLESPSLREHYVAVLAQLNNIVAREQGDNFFSFESDLSTDEGQALKVLKEIGSAELQSDFLKVCAQNATDCIQVKDEEDPL